MRIQGIVMMVAACAVAGCSQLEGLGSVLGGPGAGSAQTGQVEAEIRAVNTSSQELDIRTTDGQDARIRYDNQTRVIYQDQEYPVTALEYGDLVVMNVQQSGNTYYTDVIQVRQSVQDRSGAGSNTGSGQLSRISGTVGQIDYDRGLFELRTGSATIAVSMPFGASPADADYFRRLRTGDSVTVEGRYITQNRFELERFR